MTGPRPLDGGAKKHVMKVRIGGDEFSLRSDRSEEYTRAVAEHVDRALSDVLAAGQIVESHKAAILAALAITDDLFQERMAGQEMEGRLAALAQQLERLLPPDRRPSRPAEPFAGPPDEE